MRALIFNGETKQEVIDEIKQLDDNRKWMIEIRPYPKDSENEYEDDRDG